LEQIKLSLGSTEVSSLAEFTCSFKPYIFYTFHFAVLLLSAWFSYWHNNNHACCMASGFVVASPVWPLEL